MTFNKKSIYIIMMLILALALAGCGGQQAVIRRLMMEAVKTITVKFVRPDGTIIVLTLQVKVRQ